MSKKKSELIAKNERLEAALTQIHKAWFDIAEFGLFHKDNSINPDRAVFDSTPEPLRLLLRKAVERGNKRLG